MPVSHTHREMPYPTSNPVSHLHSSESGAWGVFVCLGIDTLYACMTPAANPQH